MNSTLLDFGFIEIKWYSLFIFIAITVSTIIILKESKKKNISEDFITNLIFYGVLIGIIGARIYYVLFNLDYYLNNIQEIPMVWNGGLAIHGGIISALIFIIVYTKKKKIDTLLILDIIVVGLIIGQAIGRWGNFFNQEAYGRIISLKQLESLHIPKFIINGMYINGAYREPTFLYESLSSLLCFISLILFRKSKKNYLGQLLGLYLIWYGIERFIIEGMRSDSLMLGSIKMAQLISIIGIICGIYFFIKNIKNKKYYHTINIEN